MTRRLPWPGLARLRSGARSRGVSAEDSAESLEPLFSSVPRGTATSYAVLDLGVGLVLLIGVLVVFLNCAGLAWND